MNTALAAALQEEFFKSWDNFVSDEFIYFQDAAKGEFKERTWIVNWPTKYKNRAAYLDLDIILGLKGRDVQFRAIVEAVLGDGDIGGTEWGEEKGGEFKSSGVDGERGMLVDITKRIQSPERVLAEVIRSHIRLQRIDDLDGFRWEFRRGLSKSLLAPAGLVAMDREIGGSDGVVLLKKSQMPRKLTEAGSKRVSQFSYPNGNLPWDGGFKAKDVHSLFNIILTRNGYWVAFKENPDFLLKSVEVFSCPRKFHIRWNIPAHVTQKSLGFLSRSRRIFLMTGCSVCWPAM